MIYQNFQRSHNPKLLAKYPESTLVLEDIEGNDWYEVQANFNGDTLKIVFNPDGLIISYSHDASALFPLGGSVAEMSPHELPKNFLMKSSLLSLLMEKCSLMKCQKKR